MIAGHQTLKLLQSMHTSGWLHRDVKPANFVRTRDSDPANGGQWRIVDFGLAKPYISKEGEIVDARDGYNEFRGSTNYASVKAHQKEELGETSYHNSCVCLLLSHSSCAAGRDIFLSNNVRCTMALLQEFIHCQASRLCQCMYAAAEFPMRLQVPVVTSPKSYLHGIATLGVHRVA